jgi:hypothetical protein
MNHDIDMVNDALEAMVNDYSVNGKMEISKDPIAEHERFGPAHKH